MALMASDLKNSLPSPAPNAALTAKLVSGLTLAIAAAVFNEPGIAAAAAAGGIALPILIDRAREKAQTILLKQVERGDLNVLSEEQYQAYVPMAWRFYESVRRGEYEHTLEVLAAYLVRELKQETPEPGHFSRMAHRVEGLSKTDLKVMTLIDIFLQNITTVSNEEGAEQRPFVAATSLTAMPKAKAWRLEKSDVEESLADLAGRGFLIPDGRMQVGKMEEYYFASKALKDLIEHAHASLTEAAPE